jgi:hypothetical protein
MHPGPVSVARLAADGQLPSVLSVVSSWLRRPTTALWSRGETQARTPQQPVANEWLL